MPAVPLVFPMPYGTSRPHLLPPLRIGPIAMSYEPGDMVRIVKDDPDRNNHGSMIRSYRGADAKVIERRADNLYRIEIDQPLAIGGVPQFMVRPVMIGPDVTPAMLRAAAREAVKNPSVDVHDYYRSIYRAMRAARFEQ